MGHPCAANPELWFGYPDDDGGDGAAKARAYERSATEARLQCLRRCPLAQQRRCAQHAIAHREEYGVWAGVKLPGGQYRKRDQLAHAHDVLRRIASGEINSRQLPRERGVAGAARARGGPGGRGRVASAAGPGRASYGRLTFRRNPSSAVC